MINFIKNLKSKMTIALSDKRESVEFLTAFKHYMETGMDIHTGVVMFIETADPSKEFSKTLTYIKNKLEQKGAEKFGELLLEKGVLFSEHEKLIWDKTNEKDIAISVILDGRVKNKSLTKRYMKFYFYHLLSALMLMSWYLFETEIIKIIIESGKLMQFGAVKTQFLKPQYWIPFQVFCVGFVYGLWCVYHIFMLIFGKYIYLKEYYRIQKHQETNDILMFFRVLKDQTALGYTLHDCINNIMSSVDFSMKPALKQINKILWKGQTKIAKTFEENGYSKSICSVLKQLELGGNYHQKLNEMIAVVEGRREKINVYIHGKFFDSAFGSLIISSTVIQIIIFFEMYKAATMGINLA